MLDKLKRKYFGKLENNFNICKKVAEFRTKIKNSPQPQVRHLSCQLRMSTNSQFLLVRNCEFAD